MFLHRVGSSGKGGRIAPDDITGHGRRIVRIDLRGHGRSDHAPGTRHVARHGADVVCKSCTSSDRSKRCSWGTRSAASSPGGSRRTIPSWSPRRCSRASTLLAGETLESEASRFRDVFHARKGEHPRPPGAWALGGGHGGADRRDALGLARDAALRELLTDDALAALAFTGTAAWTSA